MPLPFLTLFNGLPYIYLFAWCYLNVNHLNLNKIKIILSVLFLSESFKCLNKCYDILKLSWQKCKNDENLHSLICNHNSLGHVFIQQPTHPTFPALERLDTCMYHTYTQLSAPEMPKPIPTNSLCVVNSSEGWYRCEVRGFDQ